MRARPLLGVALTIVALMAVGTLALEHVDRADDVGRGTSVLVAWTSGGLPPGFGAAVSELEAVTAASVVRGSTVDLVASWDTEGNRVDEPPPGMAYPLDALAVDPRKHARVHGARERAPFLTLEPGQVLLGARSARLRGLGPGAEVELSTGQRFTVADVVSDDLVSHAEIVLPAPEPAVPTERFVRLVHTGAREEIEAALRAAAGSRPLRVRAPGEMPILRHAGGLLPQVELKERFGEFAYREGEGRGVVQDEGWVQEHIEEARVPILGEVACHRAVLPALRGAMSELAEAGLAPLVDPRDYAGCYGPRLIRPGGALSRHAWGVAVDLNATTNAYGDPPTLDRRVVEAMARWGFTWGGDWLVPDGMHFEYVEDPT